MGKALNILFIGESAGFVNKVINRLKNGGFDIKEEHVQTFSQIDKRIHKNFWNFAFVNFDLIEDNYLECLKSIRVHLGNVPVILTVNKMSEQSFMKAIDFGVVDYILRSDLNRLIPIIARELQRHKNQNQQKLILKELQLREQFLLDIFNSVEEGICVLDNNLNIIRVNRWLKKQFSDKHPIPGHKCYQILKNQSARCKKCPTFTTLETGIPQKNEIRVNNHQDKPLWLAVHSYPFKNSEGKIVGVIQAVKDTSRQKRAEQNLLRLNHQLEKRVRIRTAQLEAMNKELEAFTYSVSHDLRAPLVRIDGFSQLLTNENSNITQTELRHYLNRIQFSVQNMFHLIDDFLTFSRYSSSEMNLKKVNLSEMAKIISRNIRQSDPKRQVEFRIQEGLNAYGDYRLLSYVLTNLFENAWKYTKKNKRTKIEFGLRNHNAHPAFYVKDNGVGFDLSNGEELFKPFVRCHSDAEFPGTGIGLATVKRIIHRHGGKVWANSDKNKGASFYFSLPSENNGNHVVNSFERN